VLWLVLCCVVWCGVLWSVLCCVVCYGLCCAVCLAGKEYSKADSRYATRDDFVISMEAVTAFLEGPGCLLICWAMLKSKPWRFTAILIVSLGQLYGDVLYFGTCLHGGGWAANAGAGHVRRKVLLPPMGCACLLY